MPNLPSAFLNWGSGTGLSSKILGGFCFDKTFMHLKYNPDDSEFMHIIILHVLF